MIERRVLKEKEKRRVKKRRGCRAKRGARTRGPDPAFTLKKSHFLQSQIIVFIKVEEKEVSLE